MLGPTVCMKCQVVYKLVGEFYWICPVCGRNEETDPGVLETNFTQEQLEGNLRFWEFVYGRKYE
jgi:hypothetical protein